MQLAGQDSLDEQEDKRTKRGIECGRQGSSGMLYGDQGM
jgi:hypothetical protein